MRVGWGAGTTKLQPPSQSIVQSMSNNQHLIVTSTAVAARGSRTNDQHSQNNHRNHGAPQNGMYFDKLANHSCLLEHKYAYSAQDPQQEDQPDDNQDDGLDL